MSRIACKKHYDEATGFVGFTFWVEGNPDEPIAIYKEYLEDAISPIYQVDGINKINIGQFRLTLIGVDPHQPDTYLYSLDK